MRKFSFTNFKCFKELRKCMAKIILVKNINWQGDPTYIETFRQYIRMTAILTDFPNENNKVTWSALPVDENAIFWWWNSNKICHYRSGNTRIIFCDSGKSKTVNYHLGNQYENHNQLNFDGMERYFKVTTVYSTCKPMINCGGQVLFLHLWVVDPKSSTNQPRWRHF